MYLQGMPVLDNKKHHFTLSFKSASHTEKFFITPSIQTRLKKNVLNLLEFKLGKMMVESTVALLQKLSTGVKATSGGQGTEGCIQDAGVAAGKAQVGCPSDGHSRAAPLTLAAFEPSCVFRVTWVNRRPGERGTV